MRGVMTTMDELRAAMPYDDTFWPGYYYMDGPPPFNHGKRAHKPPGWPHDRPCWCGARNHHKAIAPDGKRRRWRFWR